MLRRNPLAALSLHRPQSASQLAGESQRGSLSQPAEEEAVNEVEDDEMAHLVANRQGEVLGPHAILKEDHFPGTLAIATHVCSVGSAQCAVCREGVVKSHTGCCCIESGALDLPYQVQTSCPEAGY
jgi:hypothetical protein